MCGHVDHSEKNLTKPIISFSLGQTAIFLMGGDNLNIVPLPIFIRSGDVLIMAGKSRNNYHGVPRIIANTIPDFLLDYIEKSDFPPSVIKFLSKARINYNVRQYNWLFKSIDKFVFFVLFIYFLYHKCYYFFFEIFNHFKN